MFLIRGDEAEEFLGTLVDLWRWVVGWLVSVRRKRGEAID